MITDVRLDLTTDAGGDATATASQSYLGRVLAIEYVISGLDATAETTCSFTGTTGGVDRQLDALTNSNTNAFVDVVVDAQGSGAASGTDINPLIAGKPKVVIAQGGNAKSASVIFYIDDLRS